MTMVMTMSGASGTISMRAGIGKVWMSRFTQAKMTNAYRMASRIALNTKVVPRWVKNMAMQKVAR